MCLKEFSRNLPADILDELFLAGFSCTLWRTIYLPPILRSARARCHCSWCLRLGGLSRLRKLRGSFQGLPLLVHKATQAAPDQVNYLGHPHLQHT